MSYSIHLRSTGNRLGATAPHHECSVQVSWFPSSSGGAGLSEYGESALTTAESDRGGPQPILGGGGGGVALAAGAKSSSLLFCSLSLKYSSKALLGEIPYRCFRPGRDMGGEVTAEAVKGGGTDIAAGTRNSEEPWMGAGWYMSLFGEKGRDCDDAGRVSSSLKRAVSKSVSPGAAGGSVKGRGRWCRAP